MGWTWNAKLGRWERIVGIFGLVVEERDGQWFAMSNYTVDPAGYLTLEEAQTAAERWAFGVGNEIVNALKR